MNSEWSRHAQPTGQEACLIHKYLDISDIFILQPKDIFAEYRKILTKTNTVAMTKFENYFKLEFKAFQKKVNQVFAHISLSLLQNFKVLLH